MSRRRRKKPAPNPAKKILECARCGTGFTYQEIRENRLYNLDTKICIGCYQDMQKKQHSVSCFGKPTVILESGKKLLGYDPSSSECNAWCPDRRVCGMVMRGEI